MGVPKSMPNEIELSSVGMFWNDLSEEGTFVYLRVRGGRIEFAFSPQDIVEERIYSFGLITGSDFPIGSEAIVVSRDSVKEAMKAVDEGYIFQDALSFVVNDKEYVLNGKPLDAFSLPPSCGKEQLDLNPTFSLDLTLFQGRNLLKRLETLPREGRLRLGASERKGYLDVQVFGEDFLLKGGELKVAHLEVVEPLFLDFETLFSFKRYLDKDLSGGISVRGTSDAVVISVEWSDVRMIDIVRTPLSGIKIDPLDTKGLLDPAESKMQVPVPGGAFTRSLREAIKGIKDDTITFKPVVDGFELVGTELIVPYKGDKPDRTFAVPKLVLGLLLCSGFQVAAFIFGINLPFGVALTKGAFNTILALATVMEPLEKVAPAEAGAKAKKKTKKQKETPPQEGDEMPSPELESGEIPGVVVTPLPEETLAIAEAIAENSGTDDPTLKALIQEVKEAEAISDAEPTASDKKKEKKTPEPLETEEASQCLVVEAESMKEVALRINLGRYIALQFDFTSVLCISLNVQTIQVSTD